MLSHLFHRRGAGGSTPSSPAEAGPANGPGAGAAAVDGHGHGHDHQLQLQHHQTHDHGDHLQSSPLSAVFQLPHLTSSQSAPDKPTPAAKNFPSMGDGQPSSQGYPSLPPTLPPIARVASPEPTDDDSLDPIPEQGSGDSRPRNADDMSLAPDGRSAQQPPRSPYNNMESGFIGGVALQEYKRKLEAQQISSRRDNADTSATLDSQDRPPTRQRPVPAPIDTNVSGRPVLQVLPHSQGYSNTTSSFVAPTASQPSSSNGPVTGRRPAGTRLATEPSNVPSTSNNPEPQKTRKGLPFLKNPMSTLLLRRRNGQAAADNHQPPVSTEAEEPVYDPRIRGTRVHDFSAPRRRPDVSAAAARPWNYGQDNLGPQHPQKAQEDYLQAAQQNVGGGPSEVTLTEKPGTNVSSADPNVGHVDNDTFDSTAPEPNFSPRKRPQMQRDVSDYSIKSQDSATSRYSNASTAAPSRADGSRVGRSRNISLSSEVSTMSKLSRRPKHMKSTSSRFSFDMIGSAKQEKLLEERHRQREAERRETEDSAPRDSRFDDFDDESFDYDAMMDDDGLEERIPGVNADFDEEDDFLLEEDVDDPDNDQDNFAGFAFSRSNGTSPLAKSSSGAFGTPQEADEVATATPSKSPPQDWLLPPGASQPQDASAGLGIRDSGSPQAGSSSVDTAKTRAEEDLYFDDGMANEFAEDLARPPSFDGTPFDESIFDNNDTDQYGRPIAGAFAQAQAERQQALAETTKRESDMTSRFSTQSNVTRSTAHTSLSTAGPPPSKDGPEEDAKRNGQATLDPLPEQQDPMASYQAALAAAAHKAAASGKFQWESSEAHERGEDSSSEDGARQLNDYESYDDDAFGYENMDDFEDDDDAIIAAANEEALANDADGWYGSEFGFYAARDSGSSTDADYHYANGGVFAPKGMDGVNRTKSGRVVSREPNLTPITERSEYSNRNSVMSMNLPPHGFGTPVQSPGLAQLAMMVDQGDEMSLSSLMQLRSRAWGESRGSQPPSTEESPKSDKGDLTNMPWATGWSGYPGGTGLHGRKGSLQSGVSFDSEAANSPAVSAMSTSAPVAFEFGGPIVPAPAASRMSAQSQPEQLRTVNLPSGSGDYGSNPVSAVSAVSATSVLESRRSQDGRSPSVSSSRRSGVGQHQRNSADSISYTQEEGSGETRWVIERRRVDESGQIETEREVVEGGRI